MARPDYYLKIDGIDGESTKKSVEAHIELLSWGWGQTNSGSMAHGTGGGAGRVSMQDFHFTMTVNKASAKVMAACSTGKHIAHALLTCREAGTEQQPYFTIKFTDVLISSHQIGGAQGDDNKPTESITFNYSKVEWKYQAQKADGTLDSPVLAGYNLKDLTKV